MAFKMKGFSYPGKAPSPVKRTFLSSRGGDEAPEKGSLLGLFQGRGNWWNLKKRNKIQETPEEQQVDQITDTAQKNIEKQKDMSKNPYAEDLSSKTEEEEKEEMIDDSKELS